MTLIECFTQSHLDNVMACLRLKPEKVVFVGDMEEMEAPVARYEEFLRGRKLTPKIKKKNSDGKDMEDLFRILRWCISEEEECVVDLTGGSEMVIMAIGAVLATLEPAKREKVRVERFDWELGVVVDCLHDNCVLPYAPERITVKELVTLYGGSLYKNTYQPPETTKPGNIGGLWKLVQDAPKKWNSEIKLLQQFESKGRTGLSMQMPVRTLCSLVSEAEEKLPQVRALLGKMHRNGVIFNRSTEEELAYTYRSALLQHCAAREGNALEVKTLLEGLGVCKDGVPLFHDGKMGVCIDWDGKKGKNADTRNEIDVMLMHGATPLFISCKNGDIGEEELYKLHTVATQFGGAQAKKMLVAAHLDKKSASANRAFIQRAIDMKITLVTEAAKLNRKQWQEAFLEAMFGPPEQKQE